MSVHSPTAVGGLLIATLSVPAIALAGDALGQTESGGALQDAALRLTLPGLAVFGALLLVWLARFLRPGRSAEEADPLRDEARVSPELRRMSARAKKRMTRLRARLKRAHPEMLPEIATYEAMLNRLLRQLATHPEGLSMARQHLEGELEALEKAAEKLSVVLGAEAEEDAAGTFRFALVQMTGEAASCLAGLRSMANHAAQPELGFLGGEPARRV